MQIFKNNFKNLNFFTVNALNNDYYIDNHRTDKFNDKIIQYYRKNYSNFQIYNYTHPLVKKCKEKYKDYFEKKINYEGVFVADIIKLYILSKIPYSLYIDDDYFLDSIFDFKKLPYYLYNNWGCIYNGNNLSTFKDLINLIISTKFKTYNEILDLNIMDKFSKITNYKAIYQNVGIHYQGNFMNNYITDIKTNKKCITTNNNMICDYYNCRYHSKLVNSNSINFVSECFDIPFLIDYFKITNYKWIDSDKKILQIL